MGKSDAKVEKGKDSKVPREKKLPTEVERKHGFGVARRGAKVEKK